MLCPGCGSEMADNQVFCVQCGMKLRPTPEPLPGPQDAPAGKAAIRLKQTGRLLQRIRMATRLSDEKNRKMINRVGTLSVYDDRIEFEPVSGGSLLSRMRPQETAQTEIIMLGDVAALETGTYRGVYTSLVIIGENGQKAVFLPSLPTSKIMKDIVRMLSYFRGDTAQGSQQNH